MEERSDLSQTPFTSWFSYTSSTFPQLVNVCSVPLLRRTHSISSPRCKPELPRSTQRDTSLRAPHITVSAHNKHTDKRRLCDSVTTVISSVSIHHRELYSTVVRNTEREYTSSIRSAGPGRDSSRTSWVEGVMEAMQSRTSCPARWRALRKLLWVSVREHREVCPSWQQHNRTP